MLSGEEERKVDIDVCVDGSSAEEHEGEADHVGKLIPDDVWGMLLQHCSTEDSMSLSTTCSWLNDAVIRSVTSLELQHLSPGFPVARAVSLRQMSSGYFFQAEMLPLLRSCPQLHKLEVSCNDPELTDALFSLFPLLPRLQSVYLKHPVVDGRLGQVLASCEQLRDVQLYMRLRGDRRRGREEFVCHFLRELTALPALRSLNGLELRDAEDTVQLCAAVGAWNKLEELTVQSSPDQRSVPRGHAPLPLGRQLLDAPVDGIAAAVGSSCPRIRKLFVLPALRSGHVLSMEDAEAIGGMTELRQLGLAGELPAASVELLGAATKIEKLTLDRASLDAEGGKQLACFIEHQPLISFTMRFFEMPAVAIGDVLRSIAAHKHSSLVEVRMMATVIVPNDERREKLGVAVAEAVCHSTVRRWSLNVGFSLTACLRAWDGCTPAAAITTLNLTSNDRNAGKDGETAALLLRCLRSCPSLKTVDMDYRPANVSAVLAAVEMEPLAPMTLTLYIEAAVKAKYRRAKKELAAAGLVLM
eukprot:PLAT4412.1.p1 GENE.PLAT4412.1~~PLAT4412.1.p1  ORF type:complete len:528 (-),score=119.93 PLAT4412.1:83-1666(-)